MSVIQPATSNAHFWLDKIRQLDEPSAPFRILNVCGGHERSISEAGLRSLLPSWVELVPGPGCPVCVCSSSDLATAIAIAKQGHVLAAYGDMLRVPTNDRDSLLSAKAGGADVRPVANPLDAVHIANAEPNRDVVFFAAGFETSFAPLSALLTSVDLPPNLYFLTAGKLTWPAVKLLLQSDTEHKINALIAPGHVAAVMGAAQWDFCVTEFGLPTAVAGFTAESLLQGMYWVLTDNASRVYNAYPEVVTANGNAIAQQCLNQAFDITTGQWRGLGALPQSAFHLRDTYNQHNATLRWPELIATDAQNSDMPKGCRCADVVMARAKPSECPLFKNGCTPASPQGPCMVSDEGACQIWITQGQR